MTALDAAAARLGPAGQRARVFDALATTGAAGATAYELAPVVRLDQNVVARRLADLGKTGLARFTPSTRPTATGAEARVWRHHSIPASVPVEWRIPPIPKGSSRDVSESDLHARLLRLVDGEVTIRSRTGWVRVQWASQGESRHVEAASLRVGLERALRDVVQRRNGDLGLA